MAMSPSKYRWLKWFHRYVGPNWKVKICLHSFLSDFSSNRHAWCRERRLTPAHHYHQHRERKLLKSILCDCTFVMNYSKQIYGTLSLSGCKNHLHCSLQLPLLLFKLLPTEMRLFKTQTDEHHHSLLCIMFWVHLGPMLAPYSPTIICPPAAVKCTKL